MALRQFGRSKSVAHRSKKYLQDPLYVWLFKDGDAQKDVMRQLIDFLQSRKRVFKSEVGETLKRLRHKKLYKPALKLSEITTKRGMIQTIGEQAMHLDLVAKARGIAAAEDYFVNLPDSSKNHLCYGSLLNCYCKELMTDKAEAIFEKMKELDLPLTSRPYNNLMALYTKTGQPEKVPEIIQEMKAANVKFDSYTYNVWMRAHSALNDISGVERVIDEMQRDGQFEGDWTTYSNIASIYVGAGMFEKADKALKDMEKINASLHFSAFQFMITLYGQMGNLPEVYRVWRSLRLAFKKTANISYLIMIQTLVKLKDFVGAEKCFEEWELGCETYDIMIANALMKAYAEEGLLEKAMELKERATSNGAPPNAKTWEIFMDYNLKNGEFKQAAYCVARAISIEKKVKWMPSPEVIKTFMSHFEGEKDVDGAEGFLETVRMTVDTLEPEVFESLIRTYAAAGRKSPSLKRRLKMEKVEVNEACNKLLEEIHIE